MVCSLSLNFEFFQASFTGDDADEQQALGGVPVLTVNFRQPSHEFTFNVGIDLLF
jgi:hypothetical protein